MVTIKELTDEMIALYRVDLDEARKGVLAVVDELIATNGHAAVMAAPGAITEGAADTLRRWFNDAHRDCGWA